MSPLSNSDPTLRIDKHSGSISFPIGVVIAPDLTQDAFRAMLPLPDARSWDCGTLPYIHYSFSGGDVDGKELLVILCYFDQSLLYVSLTANFYQPGEREWKDYSLEIEASTKQFHDQLLARLLGKPSKGGSFFFKHLPEGMATLDRPLSWRYPWGCINSGHDQKGGGTYITVAYGNRRDEAHKAYNQIKNNQLASSRDPNPSSIPPNPPFPRPMREGDPYQTGTTSQSRAIP